MEIFEINKDNWFISIWFVFSVYVVPAWLIISYAKSAYKDYKDKKIDQYIGLDIELRDYRRKIAQDTYKNDKKKMKEYYEDEKRRRDELIEFTRKLDNVKKKNEIK
jgi:hypothetical protein